MSFPIGGIEEKYEILRKLAEGGMGAVYIVRHRLLDELRVIKVIRPHLADKAIPRQRFQREARASIKLRHPNIAQIYDFVIGEDDVGYSVMELVDGLTLKEILQAGPPPIAFTLEVAAQCLQAFGYLHGRGYLHRDIAPDNIMVTAGLDGMPWVKVIDLGLAKRLSDDLDLTTSGMFVGKVRYASPEQFAQPRRRLTPASDLYSFGLVFYQLLTGVAPIRGSSFEEVIAGHLLSQIADFSETDPDGRVPVPLRVLVLDLLAKDPEKRPSSAEAVLQRLVPLRASEVPAYREVEELVDATGVGSRLTRAAALAAATSSRARPASPTRRAGDERTLLETTRRLSSVEGRFGDALRRSLPWKSWLLQGLAVMLGLSLVATALWVRSSGLLEDVWFSTQQDTPAIITGDQPPPGRLVIDAVPWAEVTGIEDATGQPVALDPAGLFTPTVLFLPAGSYRLTLQHPSSTSQEIQTRVPPASVARVSTPVGSVSSDLYLEHEGLASLLEKAGS